MERLSELEKLVLVARHVDAPLMILDRQGILSWANDRFAACAQRSVQEIMDKHLSVFCSEYSTEKLEDGLKANVPFKIRVKLGDTAFELHATPTCEPTCNYDGFSVLGIDLSELILKTEKIAEGHAEYSELFRQNVMPMCFTDIGGRFILVNDAYCDLFEMTSEELIGNDFIDMHCGHMSPDEQDALREESAGTLHSKQRFHSTEVTLQTAIGKSLQLEVIRKLIKVDGRLLVSVYVNNITEKREIQHKITEQNNRLREFAFLTSHKLRQPLANIIGLIELVKGESESTRDITITLETMKMLTGQLDRVVSEMGQVIAELDVEVEKSLFYNDNEERRVEDIWLVDDDQVISYITQRLLNNADPSVKVTNFLSAKMALEKLRIEKKAPDLLLLDINMPGINGWQFLDELRNMHMYVNVYMYSSSIDPEDVKKARSYPMVRDFLSKPVESAAIRKLLDIPIVRSKVS